MLSALSHFSYCPRRCALIHIESVWDENLFTLKGSQAHTRADSGETTLRGGVREVRALPLFSDLLGLVGKADVVEFHPDGTVVPVEYKSGALRASIHDDLQLCGQALCLEEMLSVSISHGAIYSLQSKRRREVSFDDDLRDATHQAIAEVRTLLSCPRGDVLVFGGDRLPPALIDRARCRKCSLFDACVPDTVLAARAAWHGHNLFVASPNPDNGEPNKAKSDFISPDTQPLGDWGRGKLRHDP
jgi:CRISPR-associated exonuclease Cas4